jgi:hypothetical protein
LKAQFDAFCEPREIRSEFSRKKDTLMRRLMSLAAFGFGFYYLWYNTDPTTEMLGIGAMGFALLLEFIGAD